MTRPAGPSIWFGRLVLLGLALFAPALGYWIRAEMIGDAEQAIDGLGLGLAGAIIGLSVFAMTFRTTAMGRLGWFGAGLLGVLAVWGAILFANLSPALV